jgi:hypothetical protein
MAKYRVLNKTTGTYKPEIKLAFLNLLAGVIWAIPFVQNIFPNVSGIVGLGIGFLFAIVYVVISFMPVISIVPCVAAGIIYTTILWGFADAIGHDVVRIIVKIVVLLLVILVEFSVFGNATLEWLQYKFSEPPRIIKIEGESNKK